MVVQAYREEEAEVEVLNANLAKLKLLTKKIQGSVVRLDTSGQMVKDAIGPIYNNTQQLQTTSKNIDRVNDAIDRLRQPLDARGKEESVIRAGPAKAGLQQYLGALRRVDHALTELKSSKMRSNQQAIGEFNKMLAIGSGQLQDLFRQQLSKTPNVVEPLHYLTKNIDFPRFSDQVTSTLKPIAATIISASTHTARQRDENAVVKIYTEIRGPYLSNSLQNLATASINTSTKKGPDTGIYRAGTSGIGAYASSLEGMISAEADNIATVFPPGEAGIVIEATCQNAMTDFAKTLRELNAFIKPRIWSDCFLAFEIIDLVTPVSYRLEPQIGARLKSQFSDILRPIRETARSSLSELFEQTRQKAYNVAILPNDGNTIPIVSETMQRLSTLSVYSQPLKTILSSIGDGNWRSSATNYNSNQDMNSSTDPSNLLANYLMDVLECLFSSLETRAKAFHRSKPLQGCFLSNTVAIMDGSIRSSPDLDRAITTSPTHMARLEAWQKRSHSLYLDGWKEPSSLLLDVQYTSRASGPAAAAAGAAGGGGGGNRPASGSVVDSAAILKALSSKDRDKIKEKFKSFNASFDEMVARHKSLFMEREVRSTLSREVQAMIEPLYNRFWDRYHEIDKGKGKIVKYAKADLSSLLVGLS